jgi:hypothetical protein
MLGRQNTLAPKLFANELPQSENSFRLPIYFSSGGMCLIYLTNLIMGKSFPNYGKGIPVLPQPPRFY